MKNQIVNFDQIKKNDFLKIEDRVNNLFYGVISELNPIKQSFVVRIIFPLEIWNPYYQFFNIHFIFDRKKQSFSDTSSGNYFDISLFSITRVEIRKILDAEKNDKIIKLEQEFDSQKKLIDNLYGMRITYALSLKS